MRNGSRGAAGRVLSALLLTGIAGCASAGPQGTSGSSGSAQGAVDILLAGQKVTDQYSTNITSCRSDAATHTLIFSGKQMAAFFRSQDALRISSPGTPLRVTAYRNGQSYEFSASSCQNQTSHGEINLDCKQNGNHLTATIHDAQCEAQ